MDEFFRVLGEAKIQEAIDLSDTLILNFLKKVTALLLKSEEENFVELVLTRQDKRLLELFFLRLCLLSLWLFGSAMKYFYFFSTLLGADFNLRLKKFLTLLLSGGPIG